MSLPEGLARSGLSSLCISLGLSFLPAMGCGSADPVLDPVVTVGGTIQGMVEDEDGNAYPSARVTATKGSEMTVGTSDDNGRYSLVTRDAGMYAVRLEPPLSTVVVGAGSVPLNIQANETSTASFVIRPEAIQASLVLGTADIFGEINNADGGAPVAADEALYAANVFDPPLGLLTAIRTPTDQPVLLSNWQTATGSAWVRCKGRASTVDLTLDGMIPGGTYTFWLNSLNKRKGVGQPVNLTRDVESIRPLGSSAGTENIATADANGAIRTTVEHGSCVLTNSVGLVLVVLYHINGNTYGAAHIPDPEEVSHLLIYFQ